MALSALSTHAALGANTDRTPRMQSTLHVNLDAVAANYRALVDCNPAGVTGAVVKADAYGLGMDAIAPKLWRAGCRDFFVAVAAEGVGLRALLPDARIFVLEGAWPATVSALAEHGLVPVMNHAEQLACWKVYRDRPLAVHIDTGMMRLGFAPEVDARLFDGFDVCLLMTHLACADDDDIARSEGQVERFATARSAFPGVPTSIGNSAAVLRDAGLAGDLSRPGIALYGGNPLGGKHPALVAVACLRAPVLQLRAVPAGHPVGYGGDYVADSDRILATVGAGYADGVPRLLSNRGEFAFGGMRLPIVGRVSMDLTVVDATGSEVAVGDEVEIFGDAVSVDEIAAHADTIAYEILSGIGPRVTRVYDGSA